MKRQGVSALAFVEEEKNRRAGRAGLVVAQAFQAVRGCAECKKVLALKRRQRGVSEAETVESFLLLLAGGGDCVDDFEALRQDTVFAEMVGHGFPSPTVAWEFLGACADVGGAQHDCGGRVAGGECALRQRPWGCVPRDQGYACFLGGWCTMPGGSWST